MHNLTEGVFNHEPTGFTIDSNNIFPSGSVFGNHACKGEIHRDALVGYSGFVNGIGARADSLELCLDTGGALIQDRTNWVTFEIWDAVYKLMGMSGNGVTKVG